MPDDADKTLQDLRRRIAAEGLPKLSPDALRLFRQTDRLGPRLVRQETARQSLSLSEEARRLYHEKTDPRWPWRRR